VAVFKTRYGAAVGKVLAAYPFGSRSLLVALEALIITAMENTKSEARNEIASDTCQGLHPGPANGLICRKCYDALEAGRVPEEQVDETPATAEEEEEVSQISKHIKSMLSEDDE